MIALLIFTSRRDVMGAFVNGPVTKFVAVIATALVLLLNGILILSTLGAPIPGF
jgi:manganese transport protein